MPVELTGGQQFSFAYFLLHGRDAADKVEEKKELAYPQLGQHGTM